MEGRRETNEDLIIKVVSFSRVSYVGPDTEVVPPVIDAENPHQGKLVQHPERWILEALV